MDSFQPFSIQHIVTVGAFAAVVAIAIRASRRVPDPRRRRTLEIAVAALAAALWTGIVLWGFAPARFDPRWSFPINICDLVALVVPIAFVWPHRNWHALLYFWGLSLSTQAILTPDLVSGPLTLAFWIFWAMHVLIVGGAIYILVVRRYRPTWRDCFFAIGVAWVWLVTVFALNVATGYNYGYIGNAKPSQPTLIDYLGPWPQRVVVMALLGSAAMVLLQLPWVIARPQTIRQPEHS
ncbi:MAG TPA: TIGR02206 family membrane protein [Gemmatimonadaceae bacterium]|nr:TIGR02206 family membrane protein [Gemmatimonadaceae bacterium]